MIGLWFTLRTHAAVIWNNESDEKRAQELQSQSASQQGLGGMPHVRLQRQGSALNTTEASRGAEIRDTQLYKRILGQSLKQVGLSPKEDGNKNGPIPDAQGPNGSAHTPHLPPPKSSGGESTHTVQIPGLSEAENTHLVREVAEMAATAATIAARDATRTSRKTSVATHKTSALRTGIGQEPDELIATAEAHGAAGGGHDAPNWGRMKSSIILCGATILYALIAEILVNTVDVVLKNVAIDEKFLGITLFALVPNTTEFLVCIACYSAA